MVCSGICCGRVVFLVGCFVCGFDVLVLFFGC